MLKQRTSSASQLRIQSALRHNIRNLRAKVRSFLPQQLCPREVKRNNTMHYHSSSSHQKQGPFKPQAQIAKKLNRQFDKLSLQELEELNANKHYFFGNDQAVAYYEQYISQSHPEMKAKQFAVPHTPHSNEHVAFSFIPFNLVFSKEHRSRQSSSCKNMITQKRISTSSLAHHRKKSLLNSDGKLQSLAIPQKAQHCLSKKQEIQEQKKVRRQLGFLNWQRQQQIATANRQQKVREKIEAARSTHSPGKFQRSKDSNARKLIQQYQIASLTSKLRKICLKRKQHDNSSHHRE